MQVVSAIAVETLSKCGAEYEREHQEDILERRQFGVDGDIRGNHTKPLPRPFSGRPRIGTRLYVRGNTRRFLLVRKSMPLLLAQTLDCSNKIIPLHMSCTPTSTHRLRDNAKLMPRRISLAVFPSMFATPRQPLLVEMSNWISKTRLQSALLFRTLVVYCEEHLTVETHKLIPHLQRALHLAISAKVQTLAFNGTSSQITGQPQPMECIYDASFK